MRAFARPPLRSCTCIELPLCAHCCYAAPLFTALGLASVAKPPFAHWSNFSRLKPRLTLTSRISARQTFLHQDIATSSQLARLQLVQILQLVPLPEDFALRPLIADARDIPFLNRSEEMSIVSQYALGSFGKIIRRITV